MNKKIKILFLATDVFKKGGIQRYSRYQIRALRKNPKVEKVFVFSLLAQDPKNSFEEDIGTDYVAGGLKLTQKVSFSIRALSLAKKEKIDLIICNHIDLAIVCLLIKKTIGVPYMVNIYGLEIWSDYNEIKKIGLTNAAVVVGDCNFILEYLQKKLNTKVKKSFLVYDCVDFNKFVPAASDEHFCDKYGIPRGVRLISTIGRLDRDKGQAAVIKILKFFEEKIYYLVVGDGTKRKELEELAEKESVRNRVIFVGRVPETDLVPLYNLGEIVILISRFNKNEGEGLPLGLIEASACAKPIIAGDEDGSFETVVEGKNGFAVSPGDPPKIIEKIRYLLDYPERAKEMGKYGEKYAKENFSYSVFRKKFEKILEEIL